MERIGRVAVRFALGWVAGCGDDAMMAIDADPGVDAGPGDASPSDGGADAGRDAGGCVGADGLPCLTVAGGAAADFDCEPVQPAPGAPVPITIQVRNHLTTAFAPGLAFEIFPDNYITDGCTGTCIAATADGSGEAVLDLPGSWFAFRIPGSGTGGSAVAVSTGYRVLREGETLKGVNFVTRDELEGIAAMARPGGSLAPGSNLILAGILDCAERPVAGATARIFVDGVEIADGPGSSDPYIAYLEGLMAAPDATTTDAAGFFALGNLPVSGSATARVEVYGTRTGGGSRELVACEEARIEEDGYTTRPIRPLRTDYPAGHGCRR
jgi:hypothetical protein